MNAKASTWEEISVGDRVIVDDRLLPKESCKVLAKVVEIRIILEERIFVVETENGKRMMEMASWISKVEP